MRVSVVIPTYRRPESLARCLDALDRQERPADETIVVVRDDDDASRQVVRTRARPVRVVTVTRSGVVAAMNAGVDCSSGDVVTLTDDDAAPHPDWLARIAASYEGDPRIGAVGGRDWIYKQGVLWGRGSARVVGAIGRFGRVRGNHHLGVGPARDVDILKGVNLSVRGELLREIRCDERLLGVGTEHHWELGLCLTIRRRGFRVIYDPAIAVDHYPQPRVDDSRQFSSRELRDATHNSSLAVLEHLPAWRRGPFLAWMFAIGTRSAPGVAQAVRLAPSRGLASWSLFRGTQAGVILAVRSQRRSRRAARAGSAAGGLPASRRQVS
ncbi:MAG TPA: glycosyltransferase family 2 protein [Solirubrobacteraceae bacterium]|nr:glycosyltransferase family 2 protein [Solirubrobacteraceae bacterium]